MDAGISIVFDLILIILWLKIRSYTPNTSLIAPWNWGLLLAIVLLVMDITFIAKGWNPVNATYINYSIGVILLAPMMAVMGAKQPQNAGWQWVVLTFIIILLLPAAVHWLHYGSAELEIVAPWSYFVLLLLVMLPANFIFGRFKIASVFATIGLFLLLYPYLPLIQFLPLESLSQVPTSVSRVCFACMVGMIILNIRKRPTPDPELNLSEFEQAWTRVWLDFRDLFGTLWALQVSERFNATSLMYGWKERLYWSGLQSLPDLEESDSKSEMSKDKLETVLRNLFIRFVNDDWIDQRLQDTDKT